MSEGTRLSNRNALVLEYQDYVHHVVAGVVKAMGLPAAAFDEFVSAGYMGLIEAAERYDSSAGVDFKSFAYLRIRGSVIDSVREVSDLSPSQYRYAKTLQAVQEFREDMYWEEIHARGGSNHEDDDLTRVFDYLAKGALAFRLSIQEVEEEVSETYIDPHTPETLYDNKYDTKWFLKAIDELPDKERQIIKDMYFSLKSLSEVSDDGIGLSRSWVSRMHTRALSMLKDKYMEVVDAEVDRHAQ